MKTRLAIVVLVCATGMSAGAKEVKVSVKGLVCGLCAQGITKNFKKEKSVSKVDVSLDDKLVTLEVQDGEELSNQSIETILKDAGYTVDKIDRK